MTIPELVVLALILLLSLGVVAISTAFSVWLARKLDVMAVPGPRSSHHTPTPRLGGIGMFIPIILAMAAVILYPNLLYGPAWSIQPALHNFLRLAVICGSLAFVVGLIDDILALHPFFKLAGQIAVAGLFVWLGGQMVWTLAGQAFPAIGFDQVAFTQRYILDGYWQTHLVRANEWAVDVPPLAVVVTFVWILFFMNVFNFMDGIDGIAATFLIAVVIGVFAAYVPEAQQIGLKAHVLFIMALCALLIGSALGFLLFNWPVASVFLGDCGSQFIGFLIAAFLAQLAIVADQPVLDQFKARRQLIMDRRAYIDFLGVLILTWPFVYDVLYTLLRRARRGKPVWRAHHEHLYQRLIDQAWTHQEVLLFSLPFYLAHAGIFYAYAWASSEQMRLMWAAIALVPMLLYTAVVVVSETGRRKVPVGQPLPPPVEPPPEEGKQQDDGSEGEGKE